ncbi:MAG: type VI secretion system tube protein Hcp [Burkholderiales bacterium]|nr:type VI secretion system tube protein Hcp [Burkholderiales bacterium]MDE2397903.1 type VI secretion system tube protein Hcp [Burkholderiales bacterium]MDE2456305.1 type VI secretion system tube protein Hcp [Burkholderiales bacterium]
MARSDMFLKVTGQKTGVINGESGDKAFPNQIDVLDWSWGISAPSAVGGARTGRRQLRDLKIVKRADRASTALMSVMCTNELLNTVVLTVRKAGGSAALPYFVMTLTKARITDYSIQSDIGEGGAPVLTEHLSLAFVTVQIDYTPQESSGGGGGGTSFSDSLATD